MALSMERLNLDDAFSFLYEKSAYEPVTPFRLAIYLLIRTITVHLKESPLKQSQQTELAFVLYALLSSVNLSYPEFCWVIYEPLDRINRELYPSFLKSLGEFCGSVEVLVYKDELLSQVQPRRRRVTQPPRNREQQRFITPKSFLGIFIRKLALARSRQSLCDLHRSHDCWLKWLLDKNPSAQNNLLGRCAGDDPLSLTPRMEDIHLTAGSSTKAKNVFTAMTAPDDRAVRRSREPAEEEDETFISRDSSVFRCEVPTSTLLSSFGTDLPDCIAETVVNELLSSTRARAFMERQIHLLHVAPEEAMESTQLKAACNFIRRIYCDLPLVHLVLMLNALRNRNPVEAEEALRAFFDCGAIRINERDSTGEIHLTACDARPLRYAPLLLARLARLFNQRQRARHLLTEAIQHAHSNRDLVCLRLAIVEQAAIEAEEDLADQSDIEVTNALSPTHLLSIWAVQSTEKGTTDDLEQENEMFNDEEKDAKAFSRQLSDCATLQECIIQSKKCNDPLQVANGLQVCAGANYGADRESQSRMMNDAARVVAASLKLANGFADAAVNDCQALLLYNFGDSLCRQYNTEAHVIAAVNIIYANAMNGKFTAAFDMLQKLKQRFSIEANQQCALHWKKCESLIGFDRAFLLGKWNEAARWLEVMSCLAPEEADLRKAVYCFTRGDLQRAFDVIRARCKVALNSKDFRLKIRCNMVLAMFYASHGREHVARRILESCLQSTTSYKVDNFEAMVLRRLAYVDMLEGKYDDALEKINRCEWIVNTRCSLLEKAHFAVTAYSVNKRRSEVVDNGIDEKSSRLRLSYLAAARSFYRRASAPLLEKTVLKMAAYEYNDLKEIECRDDCAVILVEMEEKYPGNLMWEIL